MENVLFWIAGAIISVLVSILLHANVKSPWRIYPYHLFYLFCVIAIVIGVFQLFQENESNLACWILIGVSVVALIATYFIFKNTDIIETKKIIPKVIKFTDDAKSDEICLLGGDLNFFGDDVANMDNDKQYKQLKAKDFDMLLILCKKPKQTDDILIQRYGKILNDFSNKVEIRFYNEKSKDAHIRGRIKWKLSPHIQQALIYERIQKGQYRIKEEDIACENANIGNPYVLIWDLLWENAEKLSDDEKDRWVKLNQ